MSEILKNKLIPSRPIIAALDIGTEKTCAMIARAETNGDFTVIGYGHRRSKGVKNGVIINIKDTAEVVRTTLNDAEKMAGMIIDMLIVNTPVSEIFSGSIIEATSINDAKEIGASHVNRLINTALNKADVKGGSAIHYVPYNYYTEGAKEIENPVGMPANILGIRMNYISGYTNSLKTIDKVLEESRVEKNKKVVCPLASGLGCLDEDKNGIIIDIGAGKTSVGVFIDNHIFHAGFLPFGGSHITTKIANDLTIPVNEAERIKTLFGCAFVSPADTENLVMINPSSPDEIPYKISIADLNNSIAPLVKDFIAGIKEYLEQQKFYNIPSKRIFLTGGGSQLQGIRDIAAQVFDGRQVRLAHPSRLKGEIKGLDSAIYSGIAGSLEFAMIKKYLNPYFEVRSNSQVVNFFKSLFMKKLTF